MKTVYENMKTVNLIKIYILENNFIGNKFQLSEEMR